MKKELFILLLIFASIFIYQKFSSKNNLKLYWFIPDGVRAEPELFNMFQWAKEGKLPNIKKLMENGSYGYSFPNFPSHTPTNFATLLTGSYPEVHGVNDGPMREIGKPLDKVAVGGFRSVARKVPAIWQTLEEKGFKVALISIPGSTPPELKKGLVIRGRWGGWGADFNAINFESKGDLSQRIFQGRGTRLFYFGPQLTLYIENKTPENWKNAPKSYSGPFEIIMTGWESPIYGYVYDSTDDKKKNYDRIVFSLDKKNIFTDLRKGDWSSWQSCVLKWTVENKKIDIPSAIKINLIKLEDNGFFRIRVLYDNLNPQIVEPGEMFNYINTEIGPMVDFVDNFPAQLIYYPEDKQAFLDEAAMTYDWHKKIVSVINKRQEADVVIHDIYSPNQMLTSRWWTGYIDPQSTRYKEISENEREKLWQEVKGMYQRIDGIVGEILKIAGKNTYIVFSSDHGAIPLDRNVNLNNLFAKKGWLKFTIDPKTGEPIIDWKNTKVIYLKMAHVYINPEGLAGDYMRSSSSAYFKLREEVKKSLSDLQDENGTKPVVEIVEWEKAKEILKLDPDRVGDLVIANKPGYGWNEEMSADLKIFSTPLISGYKQAIRAENVPGMWTPFIIAGPNIKKNNYLGDKPFEQTDQYPTIMKALKISIPQFVQGKPLDVMN